MSVTKIRGNKQIIDDTILNAQINSSAAIDYSKLATLTDGNLLIGSSGGVATSRATSGDITLSNTGVFAIGSGVIVDGDVKSDAAIAYSKLATLDDGNILVGNAGVATSVNPSGDIDVTNAGVFSIVSDVIINADIKSDAAIATSKLADGAEFVQRDGSVAFTADQPMGSNKLTGLTAGVDSTDAVNKSQLDGIAAGLSWKDKVRWASDASIANLSDITVADPDGQGQGITLIEGDRVLVKDTASVDGVEGLDGKRNGIYIVGIVATGTAPLTRTTDANSAAEVESAAVFVDEGTSANEAFVQTADNVTLETTTLVFVQFTGLGNITAGTGLTKSGNTINFIATDASILVVADSAKVQLDSTAGTIALGGAGIQIADGTAGQILIGKGAADTAFTTIGGDMTLSSAGVLAFNGAVIINADINASADIAFDKLATLTGGNILVGNGSNNAASVTMSGDVTLNNTGVATVDASFLKNADIVTRDVPTGSINGSNKAFVLASTPTSGTESVYLNGVLQNVGGGNDYQIITDTVTFETAPDTGDVVLVSYFK